MHYVLKAPFQIWRWPWIHKFLSNFSIFSFTGLLLTGCDARPYLLFANKRDIRLFEVSPQRAATSSKTTVVVKSLEDAAALDFFRQDKTGTGSGKASYRVCWSEIKLAVIKCSDIDPSKKGWVEKVRSWKSSFGNRHWYPQPPQFNPGVSIPKPFSGQLSPDLIQGLAIKGFWGWQIQTIKRRLISKLFAISISPEVVRCIIFVSTRHSTPIWMQLRMLCIWLWKLMKLSQVFKRDWNNVDLFTILINSDDELPSNGA